MFKDKKLVWHGLGYAAGVMGYIFLVAGFFTLAQNHFQNVNKFWAPALMLTLLTFSVAVVGSLIFGRPAFLIFVGEKQTGVKQLFLTLGWLAVLGLILGLVIIIFVAR